MFVSTMDKIQCDEESDLRATAAVPLPSFRQATINLFGRWAAKIFAVSSPIPVLAPVTMTVLCVKSLCKGGASVVHCSRTKSAKVIVIISTRRDRGSCSEGWFR